MKRLWLIFAAGLLAWACNQNMEAVNSGERLDADSSTSTEPDTPLSFPGEVGVEQAEGGRMEDGVPPFVKAYFMHTWVEALYSPPANNNPNPDWSSPLADPVDGRVWCTDCHVSGQVDFSRIPKQRVPMVDRYENDHEFMAELMKKWVGRLNSDRYGAKEKLKAPVTCLTCHATNPAP